MSSDNKIEVQQPEDKPTAKEYRARFEKETLYTTAQKRQIIKEVLTDRIKNGTSINKSMARYGRSGQSFYGWADKLGIPVREKLQRKAPNFRRGKQAAGQRASFQPLNQKVRVGSRKGVMHSIRVVPGLGIQMEGEAVVGHRFDTGVKVAVIWPREEEKPVIIEYDTLLESLGL